MPTKQITIDLADDLAQLNQSVITQESAIASFQQERITLGRVSAMTGINQAASVFTTTSLSYSGDS